MSLRALLFNVLKNKRLKQVAGASLTAQWQAMTPAERDALVQQIIVDPCEGGKRLRDLIITAIVGEINADLDTLLAQQTIDRTNLETMIE